LFCPETKNPKDVSHLGLFFGGGLRIRTLGGDKPSTVFKTAAFGRSASPPETCTAHTAEQAELYSSVIWTQGARSPSAKLLQRPTF
jgi:hypothetical protein